MNWIREAITDSQTKSVSAKRVGMLSASFSLSAAVLILSGAAICGHDVALALGAVATPLAGLGGYSYVGGKRVERTPDA